MPEVWLNYGKTEVALDIMAENLDVILGSNTVLNKPTLQPVEGDVNSHTLDDHNDDNSQNFDTVDDAAKIMDDTIETTPDPTPDPTPDTAPDPTPDTAPDTPNTINNTLDTSKIVERLSTLDITKPLDLVLMHDTHAIRQIVSTLFDMCEQRSVPFPKILADRDVWLSLKSGLPEGSVVSEFVLQSLHRMSGDNPVDEDHVDTQHTDSNHRNLIFVAEAEFDGLFGYETVATRLIRKFGRDEMLVAYTKRNSNTPSPGQHTKCLDEAIEFVDCFEIQGIDIVANLNGICDIFIGHPSKTTLQACASLESNSIIGITGHQKSAIVSTGKTSSNLTLGNALSSIWNSRVAVRNNGLFVLVAECSNGLGSAALQMYVEGRLSIDNLLNPSTYIDGMEDLLFLSEIKKNFQIALISVLPEVYTNKLGFVSMMGMKHALEYMHKTQGARHKSIVVIDGSRLLLR